jgi:hypothetical protein
LIFLLYSKIGEINTQNNKHSNHTNIYIIYTEGYDNFKDYGVTDMMPFFLYYLLINFNKNFDFKK